jgi:hypothetical protein
VLAAVDNGKTQSLEVSGGRLEIKYGKNGVIESHDAGL